nr:NUDIX domain-containing protein [Chloroflexota bacterium]
TIEEGEDPDVVVLREAWEETGLHELTLVGLLGERVFDASPLGCDELNVCRFYHLRCAGDPPDLWTHFERYPSDGTTVPIPFDFFWARLPHEVPPLIADHDSCLPQLLAAMETDLTSYSSEHQG